MAEEFQAAICGENWWNINPTRSVLFPLLNSSSTCAVAANDAGNYNTWQSDFMDLKATTTTTRYCLEETNNNFVSQGFLDIEKQQQQQQQSESSAASGTDSILIDSSTLQMMGFGLSSSTSSDWNQSLFGRAESNFHSVLQEETGIGLNSSDNNNSTQIQTSIDQQSLMNNSVSRTGFPIGSSVNNENSYGFPSTIMQSLFEPTEAQQQQPQNSLFTNPSSMSSYSSSSILKPSMPKQQQISGLHFSNNTAFWNASAEALNDIRAGVFASSQAQYQTPNFHEKNNCTNTILNKLKREESPDKASAATAKKSSSSEPVFKRPRIETPSPLPTFKVRKEKLGDRITALQQLVSPFGKTDTASVLQEAIEYIKFLHDQVNVLSTPYLKNGANVQHHQQEFDNMNETEEGKQDLRSRGLCLVPISSTFPVANETVVDFWTPTFGGPLIGR